MNAYKKVAFYTLGCKLNFSETSTIARNFEDGGFAKVDFYDNPDIQDVKKLGVKSIYLGYFQWWDGIKHYHLAQNFGFSGRRKGPFI